MREVAVYNTIEEAFKAMFDDSIKPLRYELEEDDEGEEEDFNICGGPCGPDCPYFSTDCLE